MMFFYFALFAPALFSQSALRQDEVAPLVSSEWGQALRTMRQKIDGESLMRWADDPLTINRRNPAVITLHVPIVPEPSGFALHLGLVIFGGSFLLLRRQHRACGETAQK